MSVIDPILGQMDLLSSFTITTLVMQTAELHQVSGIKERILDCKRYGNLFVNVMCVKVFGNTQDLNLNSTISQSASITCLLNLETIQNNNCLPHLSSSIYSNRFIFSVVGPTKLTVSSTTLFYYNYSNNVPTTGPLVLS